MKRECKGWRRASRGKGKKEEERNGEKKVEMRIKVERRLEMREREERRKKYIILFIKYIIINI